MAIRASLFSPKLPQQFPTHSFPSTSTPLLITKTKTHKISCTKRIRISSDADLASEFATEVGEMNTQMEQREEAMKKSREILFSELCHHLGLRAEEVKLKWRKMGQDDKWVLVKGFVSEWSVNFHPLSAKSVKEMVEEHLGEEIFPSPQSSESMLFPGFKRIMGISSDKGNL